jgi:hypothetical protein
LISNLPSQGLSRFLLQKQQSKGNLNGALSCPQRYQATLFIE